MLWGSHARVLALTRPSSRGERQVCDLDAYSTDLQWCPVRTKQAGSPRVTPSQVERIRRVYQGAMRLRAPRWRAFGGGATLRTVRTLYNDCA